jgi:hypothetical protein
MKGALFSSINFTFGGKVSPLLCPKGFCFHLTNGKGLAISFFKLVGHKMGKIISKSMKFAELIPS